MYSKKPNRELSIGEILNLVFALYRRHFVILYIPILISQLIMLGTFSYLYGILTQNLLPTPLPTATPSELINWFLSLIVPLIETIIIISIISWILGAIASGTCVKIASDSVETGTASFGKAFTFTLGKILPLLVALLIAGIAVGIGIVVFIIPGIIIAIIFYLIAPSILIEGTGAIGGLSRSIRLVSGRWLKTFAFMLVIGLITVITTVIGSIISGQFGGAGWIVSSIINSLAIMIYPIALVAYYYSMLARERSSIQPPQIPAPPQPPPPA